jgi:PAS domain S-box-containing protein
MRGRAVLLRAPLTVLGVAVLILFAALSFLIYIRGERLLRQGFRQEVLSIAERAAALVRGDDVRATEAEDTLPYLELKETLRSVRAANPLVARVSVFMPAGSGETLSVVAEAAGADSAARARVLGEKATAAATLVREALVRPVAGPTRDDLEGGQRGREVRGRWTALAPIRDSRGQVIALLGLVVDGREYDARRRLLLGTVAACGLVGAGLIFACGAVLHGVLIAPLGRSLKKTSEELVSRERELGRLREELHRSRGRLSTLEQFGRNVLENMTSGIVAVDSSGRITASNPALSEMLGFSEEELRGMEAGAILGDDLLGRTIRGEQGLGRKETEALRKDGSSLPIGVTTSVLRDRDNRVQGATAIIADLSQVKEIEESLRRAERLASLGEMSASIAHEIRNPLAGISAGVEYLKSTFEPQDPRSKSVELILDELFRLDKVVRDLLVFARRPQLEFTWVNVADLLERSLSFVEAQMNSQGIVLGKEFGQDIPWIRADELQLGQVFLNLLLNAVQAMPHGGSLTLTVQARGEILEIGVRDTGVGIPPEHLKRIFDPFFSTRREGSGLGLAICQRTIEEHQGRILVRSVLGRGTEFTVVLPVRGKRDG